MSGGYSKKQLEDAVIQALHPLSVEGGGYVRQLKPYRGDLSASGLLPEALQMPAVFVSYASSTYGPGPYLHINETMSFNVITVCRAGVQPDAYKVLEDVRGLLCGSTLGLDVTPFKPLRESVLVNTKEVMALVALYSLAQRVELPAQGQST